MYVRWDVREALVIILQTIDLLLCLYCFVYSICRHMNLLSKFGMKNDMVNDLVDIALKCYSFIALCS